MHVGEVLIPYYYEERKQQQRPLLPKTMIKQCDNMMMAAIRETINRLAHNGMLKVSNEEAQALFELAKQKVQPVDRPTIGEIQTIYRRDVNGRKFLCPKQKNKGKAGLLLEELLGIPTSSACLDCEDGELKAFPQIKATPQTRLATQVGLGEGDYIASETVAITMVNPDQLATTPFSKSRLRKKINNVLFVPYSRDGDHVEFLGYATFNKEHPLFREIEQDYVDIQSYHAEHGVTKSKIGKYLQVRTKGAGNGAPRTFAFYFRRQFLIKLFMDAAV